MDCPEHGRLCAYRGDEADRCPWCHCRWSHVLASGYHSCESAKLWGGGPRAEIRTRRAAGMRHEAALQVDRGTNTPGVALGPTRPTEGP